MFSTRLKKIRTEKKLTQKQVFTAIHLSQRNYQALEYGEIRPSYETLLKLCDYFHVSADYLLGISDNQQNQSNISNSTVVSNNHLSHINIKNEQELTSHAKELMNIYENLDSRNQIKLLSYAFELENEN